MAKLRFSKVVFLILIFVSCGTKYKKSQNSVASSEPQISTFDSTNLKAKMNLKLPEDGIRRKLEHFAIMCPPMLLSTNWDDHRRIIPLSEEQFLKFDLKKVIDQRPQFEEAYFKFNERIKLSEDYNTILFNVGYSDGNELSSILVNYTKDYKLIDYVDVSYYEFVNEFVIIDSELQADTISITKYLYETGDEMVTNEKVKILQDGTFEKIYNKR
jgi:hypothetical protein